MTLAVKELGRIIIKYLPWIALAILIVIVLLAFVKPSKDVAEDEP